MANDLVELDGLDLSAAFRRTTRISAFTTEGFDTSEISKSVKGADALAMWISGDKNMALNDCKAVVETLASCVNKKANVVWSAGLSGQKRIMVLAGWKPKS
ncbi:MAG: hypothetical protein HY438_02520 [DPANN group archaeon]|nr:hypothetical protein [DPANN group archaeon]